MADKTCKSYFTSLELHNVRCFRDERLDLTDEYGNLAQWTLLLGDNSVGKTTLLQCLGWMRPDLIKDIPIPDSVPHLFPEGILGATLSTENNVLLERLLRIGDDQFMLTAELFQGEEISFNSPPSGKKITTAYSCTFKSDRTLDDFKTKRTNIKTRLKGEFWEPLIIAYGANRWMGIQNANNEELEDPIANHLSVLTELYDVEERLIVLHHAVLDKELAIARKKLKEGKPFKTKEEIDIVLTESKERKLLETFKDAIVQVLPEGVLTLPDDIIIDAPHYRKGRIEEGSVKFRISGKKVPFSSLSLGYQTTAAWVLDLAYRLINRYSESNTPLHEPAIVLIDELDLHLHPRWQMEIMWKLAKVFQNTQFIGTSHSPLMVQTMPNANFAVIQRDSHGEVTIENEPDKVQGWRIDQILNSQYFGIDISQNAKADALFKERNSLLLKKEKTRKDEKRLSEIERQILSVSTGVVWDDREGFDLLRKSLNLEKDEYPKDEE